MSNLIPIMPLGQARIQWNSFIMVVWLIQILNTVDMSMCPKLKHKIQQSFHCVYFKGFTRKFFIKKDSRFRFFNKNGIPGPSRGCNRYPFRQTGRSCVLCVRIVSLWSSHAKAFPWPEPSNPVHNYYFCLFFCFSKEFIQTSGDYDSPD